MLHELLGMSLRTDVKGRIIDKIRLDQITSRISQVRSTLLRSSATYLAGLNLAICTSMLTDGYSEKIMVDY